MTSAELIVHLYAVADLLQSSPCGSRELDDVLKTAFERVAIFFRWLARSEDESAHLLLHSIDGENWSTEISGAFHLLPSGSNFSLGRRDGVYWAWIQPNDRWEPSQYESRHDHPTGSGLVVAATAALALASAAIRLRVSLIASTAREILRKGPMAGNEM